MSQLTVTKQFKRSTVADIQHWDGIWSSYYILDYVIAVEESGHPLNNFQVCAPLRIQKFVNDFFGGWDPLLERLGFASPKKAIIWDKESIIEAILEVVKKRKTDPSHLASRSLRAGIVKHFGKQEKALKAAKVTLEQYNGRAETFPKEEIALMRRKLKALIPLKGYQRYSRFKKIYETHLHLIRIKYHGAEKMALAEGIPTEVVCLHCYRDEEDVVHDLKLLKKKLGDWPHLDQIAEFQCSLWKAIYTHGWGRDCVKKRERKVVGGYEYGIKPDSKAKRRADLVCWRKRVGLNIEEAADVLRISKYAYEDLERGKYVVQPIHLERIEKCGG